jgi:hypothetical protein
MNKPDIVTKADFAKLCNVSPARVSQWISERKLKGKALDGNGRFAKIRVAEARRQLKSKLDPMQRVYRGLNTKLDGEDVDGNDEAVEELIKEERLTSLQLANAKAREEEAARAGKYALASDVQMQFGRISSEMIQIFDGALPELASAIASKLGGQQRDVLLVLRSEFRAVRERVAKNRKHAAETLPAVIEDEELSDA